MCSKLTPVRPAVFFPTKHDTFYKGEENVAKLADVLVAIDSLGSWPEVVIEQVGGTMCRFRQSGENAAQWKREGHRTATTIPVSALANILDDLFGKVSA